MNVMNGMRGIGQLPSDREVLSAIRGRGLDYPVATKADFVASMGCVATPIGFRGRAYDAGFGASLVPDFFFPAQSEQDLLEKLSELLVARGLVPTDDRQAPPETAVPGRMEPAASPMPPAAAEIAHVVLRVESHLRRPPREGRLDRETVEALDVVTHALVFVRHVRGLELWREALWGRRLSADARVAVVRMLEYLTDAVARGRSEEVSQICDCLYLVLPGAGSNMNVREGRDAR